MGEIKKQSIANTTLSYIGAGIGFVLIYIQPLLISSADIGLLRLLYSFSWITAAIMPFGLGSLTLKVFSKVSNPENKHNGLFALLLLLSSATAFIVAFVIYLNQNFFVNYYHNSPDFSNYFFEAIVFAYVLSLIAVYTVYSSALLKTTVSVFLTDIFLRVAQLILIVLYHYQFFNKHALVLLYISIFLLQLLIMIAYLFYQKAVSFKINWKFFKTLELKPMLSFAALMTVTAFASMAIKFVDQLMIGHFLNENLVGVYATCVMMCAVMEIPFNSLERIAQPKIAYAWSINDKAEVEKIYEMSSRYMFFAGSVLFCLLWASLDFIFMYLPLEYQQGKLAFYIVSFSSLFNLLTSVNSSVILFSNKYFAATVFLTILIIVSVLANNIFIPQFGIAGAALATLVSIACFNALKYIYILVVFKMQPFTKSTFYILVCLIISILFITLIASSFNPLLKALIGGLFSVVLFSIANYKLNFVEEVNKVYKRIGIIGSK